MFWHIERADRSRNATWKVAKGKKLRDVTSEIFAQTTHVALPPPKCHVGWGPGHSQPCQVSSKSVQEFWLPEGSKSAIFLSLALWLILQVSATAQTVIVFITIANLCILIPSLLVTYNRENQSYLSLPYLVGIKTNSVYEYSPCRYNL